MKSVMGAGKVPPDGGWGWMIVAAYAICNIVIAPSITNFGLIFKDKFAEMKMPAADISFIMNINSAFGMSLGLINGPLLRNFGYRKVAIVAGILFSLGITLTSFSNSFGAFVLTYGIITASGLGLALSSFSLALNSYFKENRNKATGISMTLTGLGPILYPPMISALLIFYGTQGCVLILGAICMHIIMAALLLQPVKWHMKDPPALQDMERSSLVGRSSGVSKYNGNATFHSINTNESSKEKHRTMIEADHEIDAQSIYGYEQMPIIRRPTQTHLPISELDNDDDELNQSIMNLSKKTFDRSISHVISRQIERDTLKTTDVLVPVPVPVPVPAPKLRRWFEAGSDESVHLGSSDNIFLEKNREFPVLVGIAEGDSDKDETPNSNGVDAKKNGNLTEHESTEVAEESTNKRSIGKKIVRFFDLDLLRDKIYVNIMLGMSLAIFAELNFSILTPFIFSDLHYSTLEIASLMSTLAVADILSRFTSPFIGDYFDQSPRIMYMISLVLLIVVRMSVFAVSTYQGMLCVCIALGLAKGVRTVYMSLVIPTHVPIERLAAASGLQMVVNGAVLMIFGPIVGLIRDITGSYSRCIIFINLITLMALAMWTVEMTYTKYIKRKTDGNK